MKLRPTHIVLAGFFLLTLTATQCQKEEPKLPPETQIGANTFGCYLNDELFLPARLQNPMAPARQHLTAWYSQETKELTIECLSTYEDIFFVIDNPQKNEYFSFSTLRLEGRMGSRICIHPDNSICYDPNSSGHVFFTRFDTINNIASGRFEFSGQCAQCINGEQRDVLKIQVTSGRFDVKFNPF